MADTRTSDILKMTEAGVNEVFYAAAKKPRVLEYKNICREVQGDKKICKYESIGAIGPAIEKPEGDTLTYRKISQAYETTIESTTKSNAVQATIEALKYDLKGVVESTFGEPLIRTMITLKEKTVADVYNHAFTTTSADGKVYIANDHPLVNNALKSNDNLLTGEMSTTTIVTAKNMFNSIYDQAGELFDTAPTHLLIHPNKLFLALQLLQSQLMALELSNTKNVLQDVNAVKIVTNRYLDYAAEVSPWFMLDKSLTGAGVILQNYVPLTLDKEFTQADLSYRGACWEMYGVGMVSPGYGIVGSVG